MRLDRLRSVRRGRSVSQAELARRLGNHQPRVSAVENGMEISDLEARRYADALGVSVSDLTEATITLRLRDLAPAVLQLVEK
jgi:transcriptional regulator with XRE-family HTH domain